MEISTSITKLWIPLENERLRWLPTLDLRSRREDLQIQHLSRRNLHQTPLPRFLQLIQRKIWSLGGLEMVDYQHARGKDGVWRELEGEERKNMREMRAAGGWNDEERKKRGFRMGFGWVGLGRCMVDPCQSHTFGRIEASYSVIWVFGLEMPDLGPNSS